MNARLTVISKINVPCAKFWWFCWAITFILASLEVNYAAVNSNTSASKSVDAKIILTPKPGPEPRINGPRLFGVRPGAPFIYRIPCTGKRPMTFEVENLPDGFSVNTSTGIITGNAPDEPGNYIVKLMARNDMRMCYI